MKIPLMLLAALLLVSCSKKDNVVYYKLTTDVSPSNVGTIAPSDGVFEKGKHIQLTALPSAGYIFKEWQNSLSGTQNPVDIIMNSDMSITALFEKRNYPLNIEIVGRQDTDKFYKYIGVSDLCLLPMKINKANIAR